MDDTAPPGRGALAGQAAVGVVAALVTVVAMVAAQVVAGGVVGVVAGAWPFVALGAVPVPVLVALVATLGAVAVCGAALLVPALAPFLVVWLVDPVIVQRLLGSDPDDPAAEGYLTAGRYGIVAGLSVAGLVVTALYVFPVLGVGLGAANTLAGLLPDGVVRALAFLYLGVGGTIAARPRAWALRLEEMPVRLVPGGDPGLVDAAKQWEGADPQTTPTETEVWDPDAADDEGDERVAAETRVEDS